MLNRKTLFFSLILFNLLLAGCSSLKAKAAPDAGFVEHPERMSEHRERFPFHKIWCVQDPCDWRDYTFVMIAPVDTDHLLEMSWWDNMNLESRKELQAERHDIAEYLQKAFREAYEKDKNKLHTVVKEPRERTMIVELALVELVPTKAFLHAVSDVAGFFLPGSGVVGLLGSGSLAIEGRIRDAQTQEVIFAFSDRESDRAAAISAADLTWHYHAKEIADDWASEFVELSDTDPKHRVKDSNPFTFRVL